MRTSWIKFKAVVQCNNNNSKVNVYGHHDHGQRESLSGSFDECRFGARQPPTFKLSQQTRAVSPSENHPHALTQFSQYPFYQIEK